MSHVLLSQQAALPGIDIQGRVLPAMREAVRHVFGMALPRLNPRGLSFCWELLGMDFMIDRQGQVCAAQGWWWQVVWWLQQ